MRCALFLLMVFVGFVTLTSAEGADDGKNKVRADNLEAGAGALMTTKVPDVAPLPLEPVQVPPVPLVPVPAEPEAGITTSTAAPSSSTALTQPDLSQKSPPQEQKATLNQGGQQNERGGSLFERDNTDGLTPTAPKAATPPAGQISPTGHTDLSPQMKQDPAPLQPHTTTSEGTPAQQKTIPSKNTDAGGQTDKGNKQAKTSTTVAGDMATPAVLTNGEKEVNVAQTLVTSTSVPTKGESTSPTTLLPNMTNVMQHVDKKDNTIGSSSLFALAALVTFVVVVVAPVY